MATTCPSGWDRTAGRWRVAASSARIARAVALCSGLVIVAPLAQIRSWVATICSAQVMATWAGVAIQSTNRPIARGLTE